MGEAIYGYIRAVLGILLQAITDYGPLYHEYQADRLIKEPWNAISSFAYLIPAIFWLTKLKGQYKKHPMLTGILPLLFLNGIGSILYHATRSSVIFTLMDGVSAALIIFLTSIYLWYRITGKLGVAVAVVLIVYIIAFGMSSYFRPALGDLAINMSYFLSGSAFFIPAIILQIQSSNKYWRLILLALILLILSLLFRSLDYPTPNPFPELLPQGTHFLWHIFSAASAFPIGYFLYYLSKEKSLSTSN